MVRHHSKGGLGGLLGSEKESDPALLVERQTAFGLAWSGADQ